MNKKQYPVVVVEWRDSTSHGGWHSENFKHQLLDCKTAGFLIKKIKGRNPTYCIAQSLAPDSSSNVGEVMQIAENDIIKITRVGIRMRTVDKKPRKRKKCQ